MLYSNNASENLYNHESNRIAGIMDFIQKRLIILGLPLILLCCTQEKYKHGAKLYKEYCSNCHQDNGNGLSKLYPPISNSDYWRNNQNKIPCIIKNGLSESIVVNGVSYDTPMQGFPNLTESDISNIINHINDKWYDNLPEKRINDIKANLDQCKTKE